MKTNYCIPGETNQLLKLTSVFHTVCPKIIPIDAFFMFFFKVNDFSGLEILMLEINDDGIYTEEDMKDEQKREMRVRFWLSRL